MGAVIIITIVSSPLHVWNEEDTHCHGQTPLLLCTPCPLLSATPASRIPAFLWLSPVGNEFYHQPETKWEGKEQKKVSRAEICAGLGSVLTCPEWKLDEVTVITLDMLLSRWRQIPVFFPLKCSLIHQTCGYIVRCVYTPAVFI